MYSCVITSARLTADPPSGVKVIEDMVRSVLPQFQDTPTNTSRFEPVPVVWLKLMLLAVGAPVPLETVPSRVGQRAAPKLAMTDLFASMVIDHVPSPLSVKSPKLVPLQLLKI